MVDPHSCRVIDQPFWQKFWQGRSLPALPRKILINCGTSARCFSEFGYFCFFLRSWKIFFCSCLKQVVLSVVAADHWSPEVCSKWWSMFNIEPFACQECPACNKPHVESETGFEISSRCLQNLKEAQDWRRSITICHKAHHARFTNSIVVIWTLLEQNSQEAVHILRNTHLFLQY